MLNLPDIMKLSVRNGLGQYSWLVLLTLCLTSNFGVAHPLHCNIPLRSNSAQLNNLPFLGKSLAPVGDTQCNVTSSLDDNNVDWLTPKQAEPATYNQSSNAAVNPEQLEE